jgi:predicted short-subunit dehydrogenase-like oxidoreductase (DUF2520 family)
MDLVIVGMGRAGGSLARASVDAGHRIVGILSRRPFDPYASLDWDRPLPPCDLAVISVSDGAIADVAGRLAANWDPSTPAIHVSGFSSVENLAALAQKGASVGSFHPLQTLPDPERGAAALAGAWVAITADDRLRPMLEEYATSLGMHPFPLADESKARYHAAAAAGANYVVEALAVAIDLLAAAGVSAAVMQPLTRRVVENVFETGAEASLTGPIARGDLATVAGQQAAADSVSPELGRQFRLLAQATALRAGTDLGDL